MDKELLYVWLNKIRGVGPILANNLIECFSDIDEIYHADISELLKEALSLRKIPVISGMAKGIDSYAHTIAINNNNYTIAILGTGVDKCYPKEHITLMNKIIEKGAVISQFEPGTNTALNLMFSAIFYFKGIINMINKKIVSVLVSLQYNLGYNKNILV